MFNTPQNISKLTVPLDSCKKKIIKINIIDLYTTIEKGEI